MSVYAQEYGYFFNSQNSDRKYNADSFETWLKPFFISGVFAGTLQVTAQNTPDMTVKVSPGFANLNGKPGYWPDTNTLSLETASGVYSRIDTIVLRRDNTNRQISLEVVTGVASASPQPTAPQRTSDIFELVLAQILVSVGVTEITAANITDTRTDSTICGYVTATVDQMDFDQFKTQFDGWVADFEASEEEWQDDTMAAFAAWFEEIRGQLDEDAAGHLQNEIDDLSADVLRISEQNLSSSQAQQVYKNIDFIKDNDFTIAVINGATAPHSIAAGKYITWYNPDYPASGTIWKTLRAISSGETITNHGADPNVVDVRVTGGVLNELNSKRTQKTTASGITTSSGALLCSIPSGGIIVAMNVTSDVGKIALKRSGDYIHIYTPDNSGLLPYANQNVSVDIYYQIFS